MNTQTKKTEDVIIPIRESAERLLELIRLCKERTDAIVTDDHSSMDEIEHSLAVAEVATLRLIMGLNFSHSASADVVDLDDF